RVRLRQDHGRDGHLTAGAGAWTGTRWADPAEWHRPDGARRAPAGQGALARHRADPPGRDEFTQSGNAGQGADRRRTPDTRGQAAEKGVARTDSRYPVDSWAAQPRL